MQEHVDRTKCNEMRKEKLYLLRRTVYSTFLLFLLVQNSRQATDPSVASTTTYVGGDFTAYTTVGDNLINGIGIWTEISNNWTNIPQSPKALGKINYIAANGTDIYLAGRFKEVSKQSANSVIRYNTVNKTYSTLCGGVLGEVNWIVVYKDNVYIGGNFESVMPCTGPEIIVNNIAVFNVPTLQWNNLGGLPNSIVTSIDVIEVNGTRYVYAVGTTKDATNNPYPFIRVWDGKSWTDLGGTSEAERTNQYYVVAVSPTNQLYVGGTFKTIKNGAVLNSIATYDPKAGNWVSMDGGVGFYPKVFTIDFTPDGDVIIGGQFQIAGHSGNFVYNIALWNGTEWQGFAGGVNGVYVSYCDAKGASVRDLSVVNNTVYVSGRFETAGGGISVNNVAAYDLQNQTWTQLGNDSSFQNAILYSNALTSSNGLIVIGQEMMLSDYGEFTLDSVVFSQWEPETESWYNCAPDPVTTFLDSGKIHAIVSNGTKTVYVGGNFVTAGGAIIHNIAMWDGQSWSSLGDGLPGGTIYSIAIKGDDLYAGGYFNLTFGPTDNLIGIARWNAQTQTWYSMDSGIDGDCQHNNTVYDVVTSGDYVYIGGSFVSVAGINTTENIAMWNTVTKKWQGLDQGISQDYVMDLLINETILYVAGQFELMLDMYNSSSSNVAKWDTVHQMWIDYPGVQLINNGEFGYINDMIIIGPNLFIGGSFAQIKMATSQPIVNNIAYVDNTGIWQGIGGVSNSNPSDNAVVNALAYDSVTGYMYAGGVFSSAGATPVKNIAKFSFLNNQWASLSVDVSKWEGVVYHLLVVAVFHPEPINTPSDFFHSYEMWIILAAVGVAVIVGFSVGAFIFLRIRKRKSRYIEIPHFTSKRISIRDLANDAAIKQIEPSEIELGTRIALGASGEVLKGSWKGREVALKRMAFGQSQITEKFMDDFFYEIKIMSTLDHKNVLKFLGTSITQSGEVFLVAEFMEHGSLRDLIYRAEGKVDWKLRVRLAIDAARGMEYLHSCHPPIIHRDLKSSNLLIDKKWRCKIADFGISRIKPTTAQSMTLVGTPAYMAPEVISQNKYSEKGDVYSFGIVLVELYTCEEPYSSMNLFPQQVMYAVVHEGLRPTIPLDCPTALTVLINDCLTTDPQKRPDFKEIKMRLKRL